MDESLQGAQLVYGSELGRLASIAELAHECSILCGPTLPVSIDNSVA